MFFFTLRQEVVDESSDVAAFPITPCLKRARQQQYLEWWWPVNVENRKRQREQGVDDTHDTLRPVKRLTLATAWEGVSAVISNAVNAIWKC